MYDHTNLGFVYNHLLNHRGGGEKGEVMLIKTDHITTQSLYKILFTEKLEYAVCVQFQIKVGLMPTHKLS